MLAVLAELYVRVLESFLAVFGLVGQLFVTRPWLLPILPVMLMVVVVGLRARRNPTPAPSEDESRVAQRRPTQ